MLSSSFTHFCKILGELVKLRAFSSRPGMLRRVSPLPRPADFYPCPAPQEKRRPRTSLVEINHATNAGGTNSIFPLNINVPMPGKPLLRATMSCRSMCMNLQRSMISTWLSTPGTMRNFNIVNTNSDFTNRVSHSSLSRVLTSLDRYWMI